MPYDTPSLDTSFHDHEMNVNDKLPVSSKLRWTYLNTITAEKFGWGLKRSFSGFEFYSVHDLDGRLIFSSKIRLIKFVKLRASYCDKLALKALKLAKID